MKKSKKIFYLTSLIAASLPIFALAQSSTMTTINPAIPGINQSNTGVGGFIQNFYDFALILSGILAFGMIVYGGVRYAVSGGNPAKQSDARSIITNALLGILLLAGATIVLFTINPAILNLSLPQLSGLNAAGPTNGGTGAGAGPAFGLALNVCNVTSDNLGTCRNCFNSPGVSKMSVCVNKTQLRGSISATFNGQHTCNPTTNVASCHFGGTCTDGAHAMDFGHNALLASGLTLSQAIQMINACGASTGVQYNCRCENFVTTVSCTDPTADHIHCDIDYGACQCPYE